MTKTLVGISTVLCLTATLLSVTLEQRALELYQQGLVQERAAGNLREAIALYERAAKDAAGDRTLAAKALTAAARCYEKLGDARGAQIYEQVVRTYPEQRESVTIAQSQLAALSRGSARQTLLPSRLADDLNSVVVPMFKEYCIACHGENLQRKIPPNLDPAVQRLGGESPSVQQDAELWEKVLIRLRSISMHHGTRHPPDATVASAISLIEAALDQGYPPLGVERASNADVAARLAKLLWGLEPDSTLMELANRGRLQDAAVIDQQVRRMIADPRSEHFATQFLGNWLRLDELAKYSGSSTVLDDRLRQSLVRETELFLDSQVREDHGAMDLWTANYTYIDDRLANHYGIEGTGSQFVRLHQRVPAFRRITLTEDARAGLLGKGAILALTSPFGADQRAPRTSPTLRGKWMLDVFLGFAPPPPPPNLPMMPEDGRNTRKRIEEITAPANCKSCHRMFDPMGFALENFDYIGRWRTEDGDEAVDASSALIDGIPFNGPVQFRSGLLRYRDTFVNNLTTVLLSHALGRGFQDYKGDLQPGRKLYAHEMPAVRAILRDAKSSGYRWSSLISGVVKSALFQSKDIVP